MRYSSPLTEAILLKRQKRYLVDVAVNQKDKRTIFCPNTGSLQGYAILGSRVWFSTSNNPRRKYPDTWEIVEVDGGELVGINLSRICPLVLEAIENGTLLELQGYEHITSMPLINNGESQMDFLLEECSYKGAIEENPDPQHSCYVCVHGVTLGDEIHRGFYPDMVSSKQTKQLYNLAALKQKGFRAVLVYCVQHTGIERVFPADHIDAEYGIALRAALEKGVEVVAYRTDISLTASELVDKVEVCVPSRSSYYRPRSVK